jgi:hypothetical protein
MCKISYTSVVANPNDSQQVTIWADKIPHVEVRAQFSTTDSIATISKQRAYTMGFKKSRAWVSTCQPPTA